MHIEPAIQDVLVIGGGINGTGIALDAAGRGLKVLLCEMNDLASATSSNSSKLLHGGLRYLEHYEFRLVREALIEREVMIKKAPHIIHPIRFRLPHQPHLRPFWMIRAGLFLYDHLSNRTTLGSSHPVRFNPGTPLKPEFKQGFEYSDGLLDDARLVILNAVAAREKGADIRPRCRCIKAVRQASLWHVTLQDTSTGQSSVVQTRSLVNAAGPWVANLFDTAINAESPQQVRLVKGSHIVVPKIHDEPEAYILQNEDDRIVFVIPFEKDFSLIGTTDVEYQGDPAKVAISDEETRYLIEICNRYFTRQISAADVVTTFSGVRPLLDDATDSAQEVTRDYSIELDDDNGQAPLLSVFGGKITTYRKLAETATNRLATQFPDAGPVWTETSPLPGGDITGIEPFYNEIITTYPWLPTPTAHRLVRSYGSLIHRVLGDINSVEELGIHFGEGLYQREVDYLCAQEWARTVEDIVWRRSKLGLRLTTNNLQQLGEYLQAGAPLTTPAGK